MCLMHKATTSKRPPTWPLFDMPTNLHVNLDQVPQQNFEMHQWNHEKLEEESLKKLFSDVAAGHEKPTKGHKRSRRLAAIQHVAMVTSHAAQGPPAGQVSHINEALLVLSFIVSMI